MKHLLIIGCGDIGTRVARLAMGSGARVMALVRSEERGERLSSLGIDAIIGDLNDTATLPPLPTKGVTLFYFAPPPGGGFSDPRARNFCGTIAKGEEPARIIYLSTSGVYGDGSDEPVTEESIPNPTTSRGKRRLDAERAFTTFCQERDIPLIILRVTGIYGPGRLPIRQITEGQPLLREEIAPLTNRIHADDLARVALAAAQRGEGGDIFNVSDGHPTTMNTYFNAVADACDLPHPRQVTLEEARQLMSPLMFSYATESRRLDSQKVLSKLGVTLRYPDLRAGIVASCDPDA